MSTPPLVGSEPTATAHDTVGEGHPAAAYLSVLCRDEVRRAYRVSALVTMLCAALGVVLGAVAVGLMQRAGWVVLRP